MRETTPRVHPLRLGDGGVWGSSSSSEQHICSDGGVWGSSSSSEQGSEDPPLRLSNILAQTGGSEDPPLRRRGRSEDPPLRLGDGGVWGSSSSSTGGVWSKIVGGGSYISELNMTEKDEKGGGAKILRERLVMSLRLHYRLVKKKKVFYACRIL